MKKLSFESSFSFLSFESASEYFDLTYDIPLLPSVKDLGPQKQGVGVRKQRGFQKRLSRLGS
jgi:hypothetical protein